jgi:hypothetical protein
MLRIRYSGSTSQNWKHHLVALEGDRVSIHGTMVSDMAFEPPNVRTLYGYALPPPARRAGARRLRRTDGACHAARGLIDCVIE